MPVAPPFHPPVNSAPPVNNSLYPALYLYPLNDTWAPKHITLSSQHTKIGRQTSSKTAPGERNGFFDSKVLSRQHAEVWEENRKIFIKDVRSSNGTFINGERLSIEGQESDPYELKSDDIVEFGIDIVGEDNKTIIHHKVAARVVCVFNEQDAQVAARAEQHQHQHLQQQQFLQQQVTPGAPSPLSAVNGAASGSSIIGGNGGTQNFPFAAAQRRAHLAQQGLGGMGGGRPPGKTGLSFDVILSRLQGELQKSRETGAELNSLTGTMNDIHDTLGGNLPSSLPPLPGTLPPVRSQQDSNVPAMTASASAGAVVGPLPDMSSSDQPPPLEPPSSSGSLQDLQDRLRETQSSLSSHKERVRTLEESLAEQEVLKHDVKLLKDFMEERRRDLESRTFEESESEQVRRGRNFERESEDHERRIPPLDSFDLEYSDAVYEEDDVDTRSIMTSVPHRLERLDEEDEDLLDSIHDQVDELESVRPLGDNVINHEPSSFTSSSTDGFSSEGVEVEVEEEERRREDLNVGRPGTPEPGLALVSSVRRTLSSPLQPPASDHDNETNDIYEQVARLSKQLSSVIQVTKTLEAQHLDAQNTIKGLESKVFSLEQMLKSAEDALGTAQVMKDVETRSEEEEFGEGVVVPDVKHYSSLVDIMAEWKKNVEGQWSSVREEWADERERLAKAREEYESKLRQVDSGLERVSSLQTTLINQQQQIQAQFQQQTSALNNPQTLGHAFLHRNGDAIKHYGGLVTPPSPRSMSSDSGRFRRRRRRSSGSRQTSLSPNKDVDEVEGDVDTDATLASAEDDLEGKTRSHPLGETITSTTDDPSRPLIILHGAQLATPASSVGSLEVDLNSLNTNSKSQGGDLAVLSMRSNSEHRPSSKSTSSGDHPMLNVQTAAGVVLLSIAAAAVLWKVKPE